MHAAVAGTVLIELEADFPDRPVLLFERGHRVLLAETQRHQAEQRVFRHLRRALAGIWDEEAARAAERRLGMAQQALVGVMAGAETVGIGVELRENRVEL